MDKIELETCPNPWCDTSRQSLIIRGDCYQNWALILCKSCGIEGPSFQINNSPNIPIRSIVEAEQEAREAWNQRHEPEGLGVGGEIIQLMLGLRPIGHKTGNSDYELINPDGEKAVAAITTLTAENAKLKALVGELGEALKPFSNGWGLCLEYNNLTRPVMRPHDFVATYEFAIASEALALAKIKERPEK